MVYGIYKFRWYGLLVNKSSLVWIMGKYIQPGMDYGYINPAWYGLWVYKSRQVWFMDI